MSPKRETIGQEEWAVLQFIQDNHPTSVREVADHFAQFGKARTTILTVMERLRAKSFLTRKKLGNTYSYSPKQDRDVVMRSVVGDFVNNMLGGSLSPFMAYMSDSKNLSDEELRELKKLVREIDKDRKGGNQ
ncbi:MAG: BlaI/MecI/CopY family transcriptional regulator [Planctomycetota bacterium]